MNDAKIWVWIAILFVFVFIKFTLYSPIWLIYATYRYINQNGLEGIGGHFVASFRALGQMWRRYVFFWLDQE